MQEEFEAVRVCGCVVGTTTSGALLQHCGCVGVFGRERLFYKLEQRKFRTQCVAAAGGRQVGSCSGS
jgi:hypothetical protein